MRARLLAPWLILGAAGCQAQIGEPPSGALATRPDGGMGSTADVGPTVCAPEPSVVPKLLRLSNHEYRNMVSDLLGAPVDAALFERWTPVAEVYGFDTMSETRVDQQALEEQLATAERLAALVLATPAVTAHCPAPLPAETARCALKATYSSKDDFSDAQDRECWTYLDSSGALMIFDNARSLWRKEPDQTALLWREGAHPGSTVDVVRRWWSPLTGSATLSVSFADADPGGGDGIVVSVRHNDQEIFRRELPSGGSARLDRRLELALGDRVDFVVNRKAEPTYDSTAFDAELRFTPLPRKSTWTWRSCAGPLVQRLASRAFRRPLRADELADYQAMYRAVEAAAAGAGFAEPVEHALEAVVQAVLLSPNFVFKPELVPNGVDPGERSYAVAARLGLFFRSSLPDDELWALAEQGALAGSAAVRAQALRLVSTELDRFALHFGGQWLAFRDKGQAPLAEAMRDESRQVFAAVLGEGLPPERLLSPGFTLVDAELAAFYGLNGEGRIITTTRGGLLAQGAFLSRTGEGSEFRRAIHRGLWVLTRLYCDTLPRLDPATREEIGMSFGRIDPNLPLPERMRLHRDSSTRCGQCHGRIDPIGLALEKFDPHGLWRETYPDGTPIVSDLELNGMRVRDPYELAAAIQSAPEYRRCVATKLLTFALNRGPAAGELCLAERLGRPLDGSSPSLQTMAVEALLKGMELTEVSP